MDIEVRTFGDLAALSGAETRRVAAGGPRSVKDLIESVGVPHTEVDVLLVDGEPVGFGHRVLAGERVEVYPPGLAPQVPAHARLWPAPPDPRRFLLDVHLGTLARRLRVLGFDVRYATSAADAALAAVALAEDRILVTRDRQLLMRRVVRHGYLPRSDRPDTQLRDVVRRYGLADRLTPLTRCPRCNGLLDELPAAEARPLVPPGTARTIHRFARCRACGRVYWPGAHQGALDTILAAAREG